MASHHADELQKLLNHFFSFLWLDMHGIKDRALAAYQEQPGPTQTLPEEVCLDVKELLRHVETELVKLDVYHQAHPQLGLFRGSPVRKASTRVSPIHDRWHRFNSEESVHRLQSRIKDFHGVAKDKFGRSSRNTRGRWRNLAEQSTVPYDVAVNIHAGIVQFTTKWPAHFQTLGQLVSLCGPDYSQRILDGKVQYRFPSRQAPGGSGSPPSSRATGTS